jgi:HNH endonuclease
MLKGAISMCIYCGTTKYRKIYEQHNGPIPKDTDGRTYEVHHIDSNHSNNDPSNLKCVTIQEHYDIHYEQQDYGSCFRIAARMKISADELSHLAKLATSERNKAKVADGSHNFIKRSDGTSVGKESTKKRLDNGTHPFLNSDIQRQNSLKNITNGTNNFVNGFHPTAERMANGTHNFLSGNNPNSKKVTCTHCGKTMGKPNYSRSHGDKCKLLGLTEKL